jgi:hypothetical protein
MTNPVDSLLVLIRLVRADNLKILAVTPGLVGPC